MEKKEKLRNILIYILKVTILFLILYFTIEKPTWLVLVLYVAPNVYVVLYLIILLIISKIFAPKTKSKNFFIRHILNPILLLIGVGVIFALLYVVRFTGDTYNKAYINNFIEEADEILYYNTSTEYYSGFEHNRIMHDGGYTTDTILIDYDSKKIAFLFGTFEEFEEFQLVENNFIKSDSNVQIKVDLNYPGLSLTTFYPNESNKHKTSGIELIMSDGKVYSIADMVEKDSGFYYYLGLNTNYVELKED